MVTAIICPNCDQMIYSRCQHDYRSCKCGEVAIDGGFDYTRIIYHNKSPKTVRKLVGATKQELFDDWNNRRNKYGVIIPLTGFTKRGKVKPQ